MAPTPPKRDSPREPRLGPSMALAASRPARHTARQERARRSGSSQANSRFLVGGKAPTPPRRDSPREPRLGSGMSLAASRPARHTARQERARRPAKPNTLLTNHHNAAPVRPQPPRTMERVGPSGCIAPSFARPAGERAPLWGPWQMEAQCRSRPATRRRGGGLGGTGEGPPWGSSRLRRRRGLAPYSKNTARRSYPALPLTKAPDRPGSTSSTRRGTTQPRLPPATKNHGACRPIGLHCAFICPTRRGEGPLVGPVANGGAVQVASRDPTPRGGLGGLAKVPPGGKPAPPA